jgi:hypothetical protein
MDTVQTFRFPRSIMIWAVVGTALFGGFLALTLAVPFLPGEMAHPWLLVILCGPIYAGFGSMGLALWRRRNEEVSTDSSAITWCPWRDRRVRIAWSDVTAIYERTQRMRLEIVDGLHHKVIPLEFQLTDFARLREIVRANTPQLRARHELMREFRRHALLLWDNVVGIVFFFPLAVWAFAKGEPYAGVAFMGFVIFALAGYARATRSIDVGPQVLVLKAPLSTDVVPWRDVVAVALVDVPRLGGTVSTVRIQRRYGQPIDIKMVAEGTIPLFDAVDAAWRRAGGGR